MRNAKYKIQNAKFRGAKRRIIMRNEVVSCQGSGARGQDSVSVVRSFIYNQREAFLNFEFCILHFAF